MNQQAPISFLHTPRWPWLVVVVLVGAAGLAIGLGLLLGLVSLLDWLLNLAWPRAGPFPSTMPPQ